ncbi:MAG: penicillin-binding transpeptidase domain-containing protein [Pseudomonadota bacterium]
MGLFVAALVGLLGRAVQLQLLDRDFLVNQGEVRHVRTETLSAHRGAVTDRNGELLAMSTPVDSIWVDPSTLKGHPEAIVEVAAKLQSSPDWLLRQVSRNAQRQFLWVRRHQSPSEAAAVLGIGAPGVHSRREYRRFYPAGEVTSHVLGFTNLDDEGLEGLELAFDHWLAGTPGKKRVLRDSHGRSVEDVESVRPAQPGRTLVTSLDLRLQYVAYRALKAAVQEHRAASGSVVILDVASGEVLAMVNQPSYNPNARKKSPGASFRNRAVTDIFEPGSVYKTMIMAAALEGGRWGPDSIVDTSPGQLEVGGKVIKDSRNLGPISATTVLVRSSNVGIVRIAQSLEKHELWRVLNRLGFGELTMSGFPGESAGLLRDHRNWRDLEQATLSYGYGLSVTPLQLARAYAVIGNQGVMTPISLLRQDAPPEGRQVLSPATAKALLSMLEEVVQPTGTGRRATVPGYRIAGKTGTARKTASGGYATDRYVSVFAGIAPVSAPQLAVVVMVDDPRAGRYYGGEVAAPVFSEIVSDAMRLLAVPLDDPTMVARAAPLADAPGEQRVEVVP